jgi:hypothetical protein
MTARLKDFSLRNFVPTVANGQHDNARQDQAG